MFFLPSRPFQHAIWYRKKANVVAIMTMCFLSQKISYYVRWGRLEICTRIFKRHIPTLLNDQSTYMYKNKRINNKE